MNDSTESRGEVSWGIALLAVGGVFLVTAGGIKDSVAVGNHDPGPRAIPIAMSCILIAGGIFSLVSALVRRKSNRPQTAQTCPAARVDSRRTVWFGLMTLSYIICVPFAFYTSTFSFASVAIWWFGARSWSALLAAGTITGVVWALFVKLFLVPLPTLLETISRL